MTASKDAPRPKAQKPQVEKETVKDLSPEGDEVKGGATAACVGHVDPKLGKTGA